MTHQPSTSAWVLETEPTDLTEGAGRSEADFQTRRDLAQRLAQIGETENWTKSEAARRIGMPEGTFSQWFSGKYKGRLDNTNSKVAAWIGAWEEMQDKTAQLPQSPDFIQTGFSAEVTDMLIAAQVMHNVVMVSAEAGIGKTITARHYCQTRPHSFMVTLSPHTRTVHAMLVEIAEAIGLHQNNPGKLVRSIGKRLQTSGRSLLIVDEAQNATDDGINQLRHFADDYDCGIALLGNTETYARFSGWKDGPKYGQLRRRIFKRINRQNPTKADLHKFIKAWGILEKDQIEFLTGVGMKPGALGQIDMTVKLAKMTAMGERAELTLGHLKAAWKNRDVEA